MQNKPDSIFDAERMGISSIARLLSHFKAGLAAMSLTTYPETITTPNRCDMHCHTVFHTVFI